MLHTKKKKTTDIKLKRMTFASVIFIERPCYLEKTFSRYQTNRKNRKYFSTVEKKALLQQSYILRLWQYLFRRFACAKV